MSTAVLPHAIPAEAIDAAIDWTIRLDFNAADADTRHAFERWLAADALHAEAWRRVQSLQTDFAGVPPLLALDTLQATAQLRRRGAALQRRRLLKMLALSGATVAIGWQSRTVVPWQRVVADASTAIGEQRALHLDSHTSLVLNTDTAVDSDFNAASAAIRLRRGEISVATVADRPLQVHTPFGRIEAAQAQMIVRLESDRARITVQRGRAQLHAGDIGASATANAGESWWLHAGAALPARPLPFDAAGWLDGVIAATNMPLAELLAELARYRLGRIVCDERVAQLPVSGVYHIRDTGQALAFLAQTQSLRLTYRTPYWVRIEPAA